MQRNAHGQPYEPGTIDYFDTATNNLVGVNQKGEISTFQHVYNPEKLEKINNAISNIN